MKLVHVGDLRIMNADKEERPKVITIFDEASLQAIIDCKNILAANPSLRAVTPNVKQPQSVMTYEDMPEGILSTSAIRELVREHDTANFDELLQAIGTNEPSGYDMEEAQFKRLTVEVPGDKNLDVSAYINGSLKYNGHEIEVQVFPPELEEMLMAFENRPQKSCAMSCNM